MSTPRIIFRSMIVVGLLMMAVAHWQLGTPVKPGDVWLDEPSNPFDNQSVAWRTKNVIAVSNGYVKFTFNDGVPCSLRLRYFVAGAHKISTNSPAK